MRPLEDCTWPNLVSHTPTTRNSTIRVQLHTLKTTGPQSHTLYSITYPYANEANKECPGPPRVFHACLLYKMWTLHLREKTNGNAKQGFPQINIFETFKLFRYPLLQTSLGQFTTAMRFFPPNDILYRQVK